MEQQNENISLYELHRGKNTALFNFKYGIVTPFSPAMHSLIQQGNGSYLIELTESSGKQMKYALYAVSGETVFPMSVANESWGSVTENERLLVVGRYSGNTIEVVG